MLIRKILYNHNKPIRSSKKNNGLRLMDVLEWNLCGLECPYPPVEFFIIIRNRHGKKKMVEREYKRLNFNKIA